MAVDDDLTVSADGALSGDLPANDEGVAPNAGFLYSLVRNPTFTTPTSSTPVLLTGGFGQNALGQLNFFATTAVNGGLKAGTVVTYTYAITTPIGAKSNNATVTITITPGGCVAHTVESRPGNERGAKGGGGEVEQHQCTHGVDD